MAAKATPAWFQTEMDYLHGQANERLEEFAFYVAEDVDWLNDYTRSVLDRQQASLYDMVKTPGRTKTLASRTPFQELTNIPKSTSRAPSPVKMMPSPAKHKASVMVSPPKRPLSPMPAAEEVFVVEELEDASMAMDMSETEEPELLSSTEEALDLHVEAAAESQLEASNPASTTTITPALVTSLPPQQAQDYLEPVHLASPPKRSLGPASSPNTTISTVAPSRSPRQSVAFASLPPRQPFAKKSLGHRSSQSRSSVFDGTKSLAKTPAGDSMHQRVKPEPLSTPQLFAQASSLDAQAALMKAESETPSLKQERFSMLMASVPPVPATITAPAVFETQKPIDKQATSQASTNQPSRGPATKPILPRATLSSASDPSGSPTTMEDDNEWLPRFGKTTALPVQAKPTPAEAAVLQLVADTRQSPRLRHARTPSRELESTAVSERQGTPPGAIRAAMQAASAKANAYLQQARTAFGSPAMNQGRVFTTTPTMSPPKIMLAKAEPQTPSLYPDLSTVAPAITTLSAVSVQLPSAVPTKAKQSPTKPKSASMAKDMPPVPRRTSPRRVQSSETVTGPATSKASSAASNTMQPSNIRPPSPRKMARVLPKLVAGVPSAAILSQTGKMRPVNMFRIATASQREADGNKERKTAAAAPMTDATNRNGQSSSSSGANAPQPSRMPSLSKSAGVGRQIKSLAAASQAKERAEKERERRELQKREIERKRQEVAREADDVVRKAKEEEEQARRRQQAEEDNHRRRLADEAEARKARLAAEAHKVKPLKKVMAPLIPPSASHRDASQSGRPSVKRPLGDSDDKSSHAAAMEPKRRCTNEQQPQTGASGQDARPVRVSLQKKSLHAFGQPGEPGYKKPGAYKPAGPLDTVKFSTETVRFAQAEASGSVVQIVQSTSTSATQYPPSELIELPAIASDYSDSEDDEADNKHSGFTAPGWAESPELRKLLHRQQRVDPDAVFGPVQPLQMEEIFKGKERALARFRPRSSSANWTTMGDQLTQEEVCEYAKVMGYKN